VTGRRKSSSNDVKESLLSTRWDVKNGSKKKKNKSNALELTRAHLLST
jgi:hypothetical protein